MGRTIIVSNRIPVRIEKSKDEFRIVSSEGGLATGLKAVHGEKENSWVGWHGLAEEDIPSTQVKDELLESIIQKNCIPVALSQKEIENYYYGYSNNAIWSVFHYFTEYAKFNKKEWETYCEVNRKFAREILQYVNPDDTIWIHDYHLMLLPALLKKERLELKIGFFLHIPFPSFEVFRTIPNREEILQGLLGADLIGFHTEDYQGYFLDSVRRLLNTTINCDEVEYENHSAKTGVFPMGIDYNQFYETALRQKERGINRNTLQKEFNRFMEENPDRKFIISIDRLDYTKGIARRIQAFDYFLRKNPEFKEKVQLIMIAVPSRTEVKQYQILKREVDELVGRINSRYATPEWSPILYLFRSVDFENLVQLYANSEVALLTPVRDGMNLVAKEYLASRTDATGVLILSEMAGAANGLAEALLINPNNFDQISETIKRALEMPEEEQKRRNRNMQQKLKKNTIFNWAETFLNELNSYGNTKGKTQFINDKITSEIQQRYHEAERRLFFIDYDGTMVGFKKDPEKAIPSNKLLETIHRLNKDSKNDIYIVSGRNKEFLEKHFGKIGVNLIAEHGAFSKNGFLKWKTFMGAENSKLKEIEPLLQKYVAETPGSYIEKKSFSLAWHYRTASEGGEENAKKLFRILSRWAADMDLTVLNGNKVIEITHPGINKGIAVKDRANCGKFGFILAIGDDHTDEFMFSAMPDCAITIKVGEGETLADYRIKNQKEVLPFLSRFVEEKVESPKDSVTNNFQKSLRAG